MKRRNVGEGGSRIPIKGSTDRDTARRVADAARTGTPVFISGSPGTGKSTLALMAAQELNPTALPYVVSASDLAVGQVETVFEGAREKGSLVIVDDLNPSIPGHAELVEAMLSADPHGTRVFFTSYTEEAVTHLANQMTKQQPANEGPRWVAFEDYSPEDVERIFDAILEKSGVPPPDEETRAAALKRLDPSAPGFANARSIAHVIEQARFRAALRLTDPSQRLTLTPADFRPSDAG